MRSAHIVLLAALVIPGCIVSVSYENTRFLCAEEPFTCPADFECIAGECVEPGSDASVPSVRVRRVLTVTASNAMASDVPVLVALDASRIDYAANVPASLEFRDSDGERLPHQVATWDATGESHVWVRARVIDSTATIAMHYGGDAVAPPPEVWNDHGLVVQFEQGLTDESPSDNQLIAEGTSSTPGRIGAGLELDGVDDFVTIGTDLTTFSGATGATSSLWIKTNAVATTAVLEYANNSNTTSRTFLALAAGNLPRFGVLTGDAGGATTEQATAPAITDDWHWVLGTADLVGQTVSVYVDGELAAELALVMSDSAFPQTTSPVATIGRNDTGPVGFVSGTVDEARVLPVAVDAGWVRASYLSMTDGLFSFGPELPAD